MTPLSSSTNAYSVNSLVPDHQSTQNDVPPQENISIEQPAEDLQQPADASDVNKVALEEFLQKFAQTTKKIDTTLSAYLEKQWSKPKDNKLTRDLSWPIKGIWEKASSYWKKKQPEDPLLITKKAIQVAIKSRNPQSDNLLKITEKEIQEAVEKLKKGEIDKDGLEELKLRLMFVDQLDQPLPNGETPLHYAVKTNNTEIIKLLFDLNVSPFQKNAQGQTILQRDAQGQTIFEYAGLNDNQEVKEVLSNFLKTLSRQWLETVIGNMIEQKIPLNAQVLEFAEQSVYKQVDEIFSVTAWKASLYDPLVPSTTDWIKFGTVLALAGAWGLSKSLETYEWTPQNSSLAQHAEKLVQITAAFGTVVQIGEIGTGFYAFASGFMKSGVATIPTFLHTGLNIVSQFYPPVRYFNSIVNKTIMASSAIDTGYLCYQNLRERPLDVAKKVVVSGVNLGAWHSGVFESFNPYKSPEISPEDTISINRDKVIKNLTSQYTLKDDVLAKAIKALYTPELFIPESCKSTFRKLAKDWHPDKNKDTDLKPAYTEIQRFFTDIGTQCEFLGKKVVNGKVLTPGL